MYRLPCAAVILSALAATAAPSGEKGLAGYDAGSTTAVSNANCERKTYEIEVTSQNTVFKNVQSGANQTYLTALQLSFVTSLPAATNFSDKYEASGKKAVSGTYKISGVLCTPKSGNKDKKTVQLLVHGIGFDSSYWNFNPNDETYSYAYQASKAGYSTFRYDRLGTGLSEHPKDTYNVVQGPTDLAILTKITELLRGGKIGGQTFSNIVGVGHSYGSVQLQALTSTSPSAVNAVVLTGFTANSTGAPFYLASAGYTTATKVFPERWSSSDLVNGYLTTVSPVTSQLNFFYFPYYTQKASDLARSTEQPVTQGVLFTFGGLTAPAPDFKGPVHVVTGDADFIFCLSNCYAVPAGSGLGSILDGVKQLYPNVGSFSTVVPANTGHGISAHLSAPSVYAGIQTYLAGLSN